MVKIEGESLRPVTRVVIDEVKSGDWRIGGNTNFAAAPTIYRALRASDDQRAGVRLRPASSAGEPLTPDILTWSTAALGTEVRDHYGQTEHGMLIVNGWHDDVRSPIRPGSMGQPMPGFSCAVLRDDRAEPAPAGTPGRIAVDMTASTLAYFARYHGDKDTTTDRITADGRWCPPAGIPVQCAPSRVR